MEFGRFFYGSMIILSFFLAYVFYFVIPEILEDKGRRAKKFIKFIVPLAPVIVLITVNLRVFLNETQWVISSQFPFIMCSIGTFQLIFAIIALYFAGFFIANFLEFKEEMKK